MKLSRFAVISAFFVGGILLVCNQVSAQKAKETDADEKTTKRAEAINDLAVASQLIAFGKGQTADLTGLKGFQSPEALVAAAGILLRIDASIGGKFDPLDESKDKNVEETLSLKEEANALIGDARKIVKGNAEKEKSLETLITQAKTFESRGAVGHPRMQTRRLNPGESWDANINFVPRQQAAVTFRSTGTSRLHFEIIGEGGNHILNFFGTWANYAWMPAGAKDGKRGMTIRVTNVGNNPSVYTMATN